MNFVDIAVVLVLILFMFLGLKNGFVKTLFKLFSTFLVYIGTYFLYPYTAKALRSSDFLFNILKKSVSNSISIDLPPEASVNIEQQLLYNLKIPDFFKNSMIENNNSVIYDILKVDNVKDYAMVFIANAMINILSVIIVFAALSIILKIIMSALDLVTKLPVLSAFNGVLGMALGILQGTLLIWMFFIFMTLFITEPFFAKFYETLTASYIGLVFYKYNILMSFVIKVFG